MERQRLHISRQNYRSCWNHNVGTIVRYAFQLQQWNACEVCPNIMEALISISLDLLKSVPKFATRNRVRD